MRVSMGLAALSVSALAFATLPGPARAATLTYSQVFPAGNSRDPAQPPQTDEPTDWNGTAQGVTLPRFNAALGRLTGVGLSLYGGIDGSGLLYNPGPGPIDINGFDAAEDITLLAPGTPVPWDGSAGELLTVRPVLFHLASQLTLQAGQTYSFGPTAADASGSASLPMSDLPAYVGLGNLDFPLFAVTNNAPDTNGGDLTFTPAVAARAAASITYTYDPAVTDVPEPSTAALLGAGLLSLTLLRRR